MSCRKFLCAGFVLAVLLLCGIKQICYIQLGESFRNAYFAEIITIFHSMLLKINVIFIIRLKKCIDNARKGVYNKRNTPVKVYIEC